MKSNTVRLYKQQAKDLINEAEIEPLVSKSDNGNEFYRYSPIYSIDTRSTSYPEHKLSKTNNHKNYTIDKTRILEVLSIDDAFSSYFVAPRKFGKTFTASMICSFYDYYYKDVFDELFQGTYIYQQINESYLINRKSKYFVFEVSFSHILTSNNETYANSFLETLYNALSKFSTKYFGIDLVDRLKKILKEKYCSTYSQILYFFQTLIGVCTNDYMLDGLSHFSLLIFIDDCEGAYLPYYKDIINGRDDYRLRLFSIFLGAITRNFDSFGSIRKPCLLMVGLIPLPNSITAGKIDYICCHDFLSPIYSHFIGFLSADVEQMFNDFNVSQHGRELLRNYFNNYQLCPLESFEMFNKSFSKPMNWNQNLNIFYNPWSLMTSIKEGSIIQLFSEGCNQFGILDELLEDPKYFDIIIALSSKRKKSLLNGFRTEFSTMDDYINIWCSESFIKLLIISGFLCYSDGMIWIPNQEILEYFQKVIKKHFLRLNVPLELPITISKYLMDRNLDLFFCYTQLYINKYIPNIGIFNGAVINSLLYNWFFTNLKNCKVITQYCFYHKPDETKGIIKSYADIVIIDEYGLAIVIKLEDSRQKYMNLTVQKGYEQVFSPAYYPFYEFQNVKEVVLCSFAMTHDGYTIIFSSPISIHRFHPNIKLNDIPNRTISTSYDSFLGCKIIYIQSTRENAYKLINSQRNNSSIIIVNHLSTINGIESLSSWMKISGHNSKEERDFVINSHPQKYPYLIVTLAALRGLDSYPSPDVVFLLEPPEIEDDLFKVWPLCKKELILFYDESHTELKYRTSQYFSQIKWLKTIHAK